MNDFGIQVAPNTQTVNAGSQGSYVLTVAPTGPFPRISVPGLRIRAAVAGDMQLLCRQSDSESQQWSAEQNARHHDGGASNNSGQSVSARPDLCVLVADFRAGIGQRGGLAATTLVDCDGVGSGAGRDHSTGGLLEHEQHEHYGGHAGWNLYDYGECDFR